MYKCMFGGWNPITPFVIPKQDDDINIGEVITNADEKFSSEIEEDTNDNKNNDQKPNECIEIHDEDDASPLV